MTIHTNSPDPPARLTYRVDEVAAMLGVCRRTVERAIAEGKLEARKVLGVTLIPAASVNALLETAA
jgi:excisionase family DNA binding protein